MAPRTSETEIIKLLRKYTAETEKFRLDIDRKFESITKNLDSVVEQIKNLSKSSQLGNETVFPSTNMQSNKKN